MRRPRGRVLSAVMLAACVAAAGAVPGEEWAERLRLLEARFEKSEQRAAALKEEYEFQYQLAAGEDADRVSVRFVPFNSAFVEG